MSRRSTTYVAERPDALKRLSLRHNFAWTLAGNVIYSGCQWGILVALARIGGPAVVGQFALGLAVTTPIFMFTSLQLRAIQATDAQHEFSFTDYFGLRVGSTLLAFPVIAILLLVSHYPRQSAAVILIIAFSKAFESISDIIYGLLQQKERMDWIAVSMVIRGLLSLAALSVTTYMTGSIVYGTMAMAISWLAALLFFDMRLTQNGASIRTSGFSAGLLHLNWPALLKLARAAMPMGVVMMLLSLNSNLPRYFIEHYSGSRALGIFAALGYMMQAGAIVVTALGNAATPRLASLYAERRSAAFRTLLFKLVGLAAVLGALSIAIAYFFGHRILLILYGPEYADQMKLFLLLMGASAITFVGSFLGLAVTAKRRFVLHVPIQVALLGLGSACCYYFVKSNGLIGAGYAVLLLSLFSAVAYAFALLVPVRRESSLIDPQHGIG